ncbi:hypothetical protein CDAR_67901 [Caerostris darwini]|uniref:Uncharacterized protein n=1 Tax=Caerostris darwini TaxID=1538125 RepID=A0AAV4VT48_9ARAC|nr:hypothetical protein CDAR_67901 [Caerostris darwini]
MKRHIFLTGKRFPNDPSAKRFLYRGTREQFAILKKTLPQPYNATAGEWNFVDSEIVKITEFPKDLQRKESIGTTKEEEKKTFFSLTDSIDSKEY